MTDGEGGGVPWQEPDLAAGAVERQGAGSDREQFRREPCAGKSFEPTSSDLLFDEAATKIPEFTPQRLSSGFLHTALLVVVVAGNDIGRVAPAAALVVERERRRELSGCRRRRGFDSSMDT